jgi:hypothetical protein
MSINTTEKTETTTSPKPLTFKEKALRAIAEARARLTIYAARASSALEAFGKLIGLL